MKNWPPVWTQTRKDSTKTVRGEIGVLQYVYSNPRPSSTCYLVIDYEGDAYIGALVFESRAFCKQVVQLLNAHLKRSINEISDLEIPDTF